MVTFEGESSMTLRPVPEKELTRLHGRPEQGRGAHGQPHHGSIRGRVIDMDDSVALLEQRRLLDHMTNPSHCSSRAGASWEINDVGAALHFEPAKQLHGAVNTSGEGRVFHCSANLNIAALVSEVKDVASDFDARHVFAEVNRAFHAPISPFAEQQGIDGEDGEGRKRLTRFVTRPLRPSAFLPHWNAA